ncbi:MAG: M23 family metallopeptidase, partial [bacterium]|nr:M23 family metallopeptidase [bacterium]
MRLSKVFILGLCLVLIAELVYAYNWPFAKPNDQVEIAGVLGELRLTPTKHFHRGVDLVKIADTPVYSVIEGEVAKRPTQNGQVLWIKYIGSDYGYSYIHIKDHTGTLQEPVLVGDRVYPIGHPECKLIGKVREMKYTHLHFEEVYYNVDAQDNVTDVNTWNNPLYRGGLGAANNSEWGFKDNAKPKIDDVGFYTQGTEIPLHDKMKLYGKIDIAVAAHDARILGNGNPGSTGGLGVKRVSCKIYDLRNPHDKFLKFLLFNNKSEWEIVNYISTNNIHLPLEYENSLIFDSIPKYSSKAIELSKLALTYRSNSNIDRPVYWVTNMPDIGDRVTYTNSYWDTTIRTDGRHTDGPYLVEIEVEDFRGNTTTTHRFVRVDNKAPYLDTVGAYQMEPFDIKQRSEKQHVKSICLEKIEKEKLAEPKEIKEMYVREQDELIGYQAKYFASWEENQNGRRELNISLKKPVMRGVESKFLLLFSQPVNIDSAVIFPISNVKNRISIKLNSQNEELSYYISDPFIIPSSIDWDGKVLLSVDAYDVNENHLDSDPRTIAVRDNEWEFHTGYEKGSDMNHFFELPVAPRAPSDFTANVIIQNRQPQWINLYWKDNSSNEDGFALFQRKDGEKNYSLAAETGSNTNSIEGIIPPEQGVYFYTVRAFKKQSGYSVPALEQMAVFVPGGEDSDLIPPGGRIIYEQEGMYVKGSVTIKAKVWDNVGVKKVEFYCSSQGEEYFIGESSNFFYTPEGTFTIYEWDSSSFRKAGDGILCYIRDYTNNRSASENVWSIGIDNIPPTGISNLQTLDTWTNINCFGASWDAAQDYESYVEGYYYSLNSSPKENASFTFNTGTGDLILPEDSASGVYSIYIAPKDAAGNIGPTSRGLLFYDISPPIITNFQSTPNIVFASKTVKFTARVEDVHSGVQWVIISTSVIDHGMYDQGMYDNGIDGDETANDGIYTTYVTIPDDTNVGIYNLVVSAYDNCPNSNIATSTITLQIGNPDYTPPTITNPQATPNTVLRGGTVTFTVRVADERSGVGTVTIGLIPIGGNANQQMYDNGSYGDKVADDGIYTCQATITNSVPVGPKKLIITATDNVGNISQGTITLQVINPKITSVLPASGTIGTNVTIKGKGYLATEQIRIDFGTTLTICLTTTDAQGSFTATFKVDSQDYGLKTITATGITSGGVTKSNFTIPIPPGSISGTVTTSTGRPIP